VPGEPPSFDLVVATLGRVSELGRLLDSLAAQTRRAFRVLVVDQNDDDRIERALARGELDLVRLPAPPGLAHARNRALPELRAEVVAFPDDDCVYPPDLLERVAARFTADPSLDGVSGRTADGAGRSDKGWSREPQLLRRDNVWNLVASAGLFLRRPLVERVGEFDERLGLGSGTPYTSSEETDYVIRALTLGAKIAYDPSLVVGHDLAASDRDGLRSRGRREGASVGYLLRKHGYPLSTLARMAVRPLGGVAVNLARRDTARARFYAETLRGRVRGYLDVTSSKISA
jgi:glycosyltransferase involved in cell wall biosynthesis